MTPFSPTMRAGAAVLLSGYLAASLAGCSSSPVARAVGNPLSSAEKAAVLSDQLMLGDVANAEQAYFAEQGRYAANPADLAAYLAAPSASHPLTLRTSATAFCAIVTDAQFPAVIVVYDSKLRAAAPARPGDCRASAAWLSVP